MTSFNVLHVGDEVQTILDAIPTPVFVIDRQHRLVLCNAASLSTMRQSREGLIGRTMAGLIPDEQFTELNASADRVFETGCDAESEHQVTAGDGRVLSIVTRKRLIRLGGEAFMIGVSSDITERREAEAHNRYLAFHDAMTGLPNRALLNERIEQALLRGHRRPDSCALLYIDLDRFKEVNDSLGHAAGDELLTAFASRLSSIARGSDTVARLGGDEFAILLNDIGETFDPEDICGRILGAADAPFEVAGGEAHVGASIGIVRLGSDPIERDEFHRRADLALYDAKHAGRGCFREYSALLDERSQRTRRLERDLCIALANGRELEVYYQPVVGPGGDVSGMEALARWNHPVLGLLMPAEFIPIAEQSGLIMPLGDWVLDQATRMIAKWPDITIAVNLSPVQLTDDDVVDRFLAIVDANRLPRERLQLEVTESTALAPGSDVAGKLHRLRVAGVRIVLDDFGTGYSSLAHLQRLEFDRVKIDQSFVCNLDASADSRAIIQAVLGIGRTLGVAVTAEGVETEGQRQFLQALGCSDFQGYLFSTPLSEALARDYLDGVLPKDIAA